MSSILDNPASVLTSFIHKDRALIIYKELHDDITNNGVSLQFNERHALSLLAVMMVECEILAEDLYTNGDFMVVNGDKGNMVTKKNPARDALEKLRPKVITMLKEFKMTPASRKVQVAEGGTGSSEDDEFNGF